MSSNDAPISPLRQRMIEDMSLRKLKPKTLRPRRRTCAASSCRWCKAGLAVAV